MGIVLSPSGRAGSSVFYQVVTVSGSVSTETCFFRSHREAEEKNKAHLLPWIPKKANVSAWCRLLPPFVFEHSKGSGMRAVATVVFCGTTASWHLSFCLRILINCLLSNSEYGLPV